jgi:hypothetical protein
VASGVANLASDVAQAATGGSAPAGKPAARKAAGKTAGDGAAPGVVDPMQWWGALTQQFQHIAATAMKDAARQTALDATRNVATGLAKEALKTATKGATRKAPAKKAAAKKAPARKAAPRSR